MTRAASGHDLGPAQDAVPIRVDPRNALDYGKSARGLSPEERRIGFDLVGNLNRLKGVESPDNPALSARINSMCRTYEVSCPGDRLL